MHSLKSTVLAVAAAFGGVTAASAGEIIGAVNPSMASVSLSVGTSERLATYHVTLTNISTSSAINIGRLVGSTSTDGAAAAYRAASGATCTTTNAPQTGIDCNVGSIAAGASKSFDVSFASPTSGNQMTLAWQAIFNSGDSPGYSNGNAGTTPVTLDAINDSKVTSDVPANVPLTLYTGGGVASPADTWTTTVIVPGSSAATTAVVEEVVSAVTCAPDLLTCSTSTLTIPTTGTFADYLTITLRRDASTIAKGAKIGSALVSYQHVPTSPVINLLSCTDTTYALQMPVAGIPCIESRTAYPARNSKRTPVAAGFEGDWEFVIKAVDNGKYFN
jgi:hypothetical protein